jgi:glycosyltransferase involved in cell wall biosynthesis
VIRVLLLIPTLDASGAEKQFSLLAANLPRDRFELHVAVLTRGGPYEGPIRRAGIPVTVLNKRFKADPVALGRLRKLIATFRPHVLHAWLFAANAYGRLAAGSSTAPIVIVSERCVDSWKSRWQLWLDRQLIGRTAALVANSESVAEFYRNVGVPSEKIRVIPNGIELSPQQAVDRAALLAEFGLPPDAKIVASVGRLAKQKRVDVLIWATQLLRQLTDNVFHVIVGDGPERRYLEQLARHFTCDHVTRFVGHRSDVARLWQCFDVFWLASDFEGQSNSLMEAMAHGLPSIVSDIPANRELIDDGRTGYVIRPGDSVAFAQYADRLLADRDVANRLGAAAREHIAAHHSVSTMVDAYAELYEVVAAGSALPASVARPAVGGGP